MRKYIFVLSTVLVLAAGSLSGQTAGVILHPADSKIIVNKNIYGHFAEHLGHCIYDGMAGIRFETGFRKNTKV